MSEEIRPFPKPAASVEINRRSALAGLGLTVTASWIGAADAAAGGSVNMIAAGTSDIAQLDQATNITAAPSPDGSRIAFDLLGLLWLMPSEGGTARCLTDAFADIAHPHWSPDGEAIAFQSYRTGNFQIWMIDADGGRLRQVTDGPFDCREPRFTPDGEALLFSSDRTGTYAIHRLDLSSGKIVQISSGPGQHSEPCLSHDGRRLAYVRDDRTLILLGEDGKEAVAASVPKSKGWMTPAELRGPVFAPDGTLVFVTISDGASTIRTVDRIIAEEPDIYPFRPGWLPGGDMIFAANGHIRRLGANGEASVLAFNAPVPVTRPSYRRRAREFSPVRSRPVVGISSPALSPDGSQIAFGALNDIYILTLGDPKPRRLTSHWSSKSYPAWSPDGSALVYSDDRSGTANLWLHNIATQEEHQLSNLPDGAAATLPFWSSDGKTVGFHNHKGALHLVDVETGFVRQIFEELWLPGRGSFNPDGTRIAMAAFKPSSPRYREGLSEVLLVDPGTGTGSYTPVGAGRSIATRGDDGPVWSPDGKYLAYVYASTLWIQPVDPDGTFGAAPRRLTDTASDCPSWSGDSRSLLYLGGGRLRIVDVDTSASREIPMRLNWSSARAPRRTVIQHSRIWDGLKPGYSEADLILEGNRIAAIVERASGPRESAEVIDGKGLTLLPGLVDMHTHRHIHGAAYGDRMGRLLLSLGITTTRSVGGAAYHGVEDREAIEAGNRIGPRHFTTGEALDGGRIYYNFMRPLTEPGQLDLEFERAEALAYDVVKTYVRLDHQTQAEVIARAHARGMPVTSHYHYPALRHGADGTEHLGATNRFGFSRTATAAGSGYDDVNALFAAARAGRTPTLFLANALLPENADLVTDVRVRHLLPRWDLGRLDMMKRMMDGLDRSVMLTMLARQVGQIAAIMEKGWHVHSGTDAPIDTIGVSLHMNLRAMARFGITTHDVLLSATRHAGQALNAPLGTIAPGQLADIILVEGDPLVDISALARTRIILANGRQVTPPSLIQPYRPESSPPPHSKVQQLASTSANDLYWHQPAYVAANRASCCSGEAFPHA